MSIKPWVLVLGMFIFATIASADVERDCVIIDDRVGCVPDDALILMVTSAINGEPLDATVGGAGADSEKVRLELLCDDKDIMLVQSKWRTGSITVGTELIDVTVADNKVQDIYVVGKRSVGGLAGGGSCSLQAKLGDAEHEKSSSAVNFVLAKRNNGLAFATYENGKLHIYGVGLYTFVGKYVRVVVADQIVYAIIDEDGDISVPLATKPDGRTKIFVTIDKKSMLMTTMSTIIAF